MENNHTHNHNHNQLVNKLHQHPHHHHHHVPFPSTSVLLIVIPIIIIILLVSILVLIIMLRRLHHSKENVVRTSTKVRNSITNKNCLFIPHSTININSSPENDGGCLYSSTTTGSSTQTSQSKLKGVQVFTYKEVEMATEGFSEANVIGIGGYGVVYRGILSDGTVAAIKMLRRQGKQGERAFRLEVDLLSRLQSPYLVELLGYCADQHHRLLIFEFMPNGPLQHHLHPTNKKQAKPLSWGTRLGIALDCARALEYLHEYTTPSVIHRDFKCTNVLLDENYQAKVSDFELAKIGSDKLNGLISTRVLGTTGYLAPEYASTGKLTTKSDVYSYGVVLLELLTGRVPIDTQRPPGEHVLVSWALPRLTNRDKLVEMVDPAIQGQYSKKDLIQVAAIAAMCIQTEADYRPLMTDVVQSLVPLAKNYSSGNASISSSFRCTPRVSPRSIN